MNLQNNLLAKSLPIVAQALGNKLGVNVIIGKTSGACTDHKNIYLPALPLDDAKAAVLANGYIDHEAAHIRFTQQGYKDNCENEFAMGLANLFEDIRIEKAMCNLYPGCKVNLANLVRVLVEDGDFSPANDNDHPATVLSGYLLYRLRADVLNQIALIDVADRATRVFKSVFPAGIVTRVTALMYKVENITSSIEAYDLSNELMAILKDESEKEKEKQKQDQQSSNDAAANSDSQSADDSDDAGDQANDSTGNTAKTDDSIDDTSDNNSQAGSMAADSSNDDDSAQSVDGQQSQADAKKAAAIDKTLDAANSDMPDDISTILERGLGNSSSETSVPITVGSADRHKTLTSNGNDLLQEARLKTSGLQTRLRGLVQSTQKKRIRLQPTGQQIATNQLHRIATMDTDIFLGKKNKKTVNTAVQILLDCSGSMGNDIHTAKVSALATAYALDMLQGVSVGAAAFPGYGKNDVNIMSLLGETVTSNTNAFDVSVHGLTPMGEAMWWAATQLAACNEPRRIMLVVTDGDPDRGTEDSIEELINLCSHSGIECIGLGIGSLVIADKFPIWRTINNIEELTNAMFEIFKQQLVIKAA